MTAVTLLLLLVTQRRAASARVLDSLEVSARPSMEASNLSFQLSSGLGYNPAQGGSELWSVKLMFGTLLFSTGGTLWAGIEPTMVPQSIGDENAVDGFVSFVIEYEHDFHIARTTTFLYANAGSGPQFGDRSTHLLFQAVMFSAGVGIRDGGTSGFFGQLGITYNTVPMTNAREFLILNAGVFF
jgi:hypothetical protein